MISKLLLTLGFAAYVVTTVMTTPRCEAEELPPPVLNPKTYTSPSVEYKLEVDPSTMYGQGEGRYRFTRSGVEVWSAKHPFALWDTAVTNDGIVAGYAYTYGWRGFAPESSPDRKGNGDFHVVIFDPQGKLRLNEVVPREHSRFLHSPPTPLANGMFIDPANDRFVVRVADPDLNRSNESWWVYHLSTGKRMARLEPKSLMKDAAPARFVIDARPIRGTPLTLIHWWLYAEKTGGRFTLVDLAGKPVWTLNLPQDYSIPNDEDAEDRLQDYIREHGAILRSDEPNRFDLRLVAEGKRAAFRVIPATDSPTGWEVSEIGRSNFVLTISSAPAPVEIAPITLKPLGTIRLRTQVSDTQPVRDVHDFDVDGRGRLGFVRGGSDGPATVVIVGPDGRIAREIPLLGINGAPKLAWLEGDRWIAVVSGYGENAKAAAWWVQLNPSRLEPIVGFDCPQAEAIQGTRDGGFVALTTHNYRYTMTHELIAFDRNGQSRWRVGQDYQDPAKLFSPTGLAVTTRGTVAVSDVIAKRVQFYDRRNGQYLRTLDLKAVFRREPNYPSRLAADVHGGLVVHDFNGSPPIWRVKADGTVLAKFEPRYEDGRTFPLHAGVKTTSDGRLWTCDGESLLRLRDDGVVDLIRGEAPSADQLGEIAGLNLDEKGHIYAVSRRTAAVHVYDTQGRPVRICGPLPTDFPSNEAPEQITIAGDGSVYIGHRDGRYLRFDSTGKRVGFEKLGLDPISENWQFQTGTQRRWVGGYLEAYLVGDSGKVLRTIKRRPNGTWLEKVDGLAVAPDGSVAIVASDSRSFGGSDSTVNLYMKDGEPIRTIAVPGGDWVYRVAYNGRSVVASLGSDLLIISAVDATVRRFTSVVQPDGRKSYWSPFFAREGKELWLFRDGTQELRRFGSP
jgi:hypothetical protein